MSTRQLIPKPVAPILPALSPMRSPILQRKCACGGSSGLTGECEDCRKRRLQRKADNLGQESRDNSNVPSIVHEVLRSNGQPLDTKTRAFFEPRFGHDFSSVRVHTNTRAAESADTVNALAYTVGRNIVFGYGKHAPENSEGRRLMAHELTHVVQQGPRVFDTPLDVSRHNDPAEQEARVVESGLRRPQALIPSRRERAAPILARGEKWDAITAIGPWDAYKAKQLADKALVAAQRTGLPGLRNGPADAWRHCYWNCTMTAELGFADAQAIADNHERHGGGPANEDTMDFHNNLWGRLCGGKNCDACCQNDLNTGVLRVIDSTGSVVPSVATPRTTPLSPGSGKY